VKVPFLPDRDSPGSSSGASGPSRDATVVLLVDDELAQRQLFANALRQQGYHVLEAHNGAEAITLAQRAGRIDLIVTDVVMPGMKGPELVARLREQYPAVQVLFVSGFATTEEIGRNAHFLQKPFLRRDLLARVFEVIGPPRSSVNG
jgi:two-component system, cell cycle sensor histidine kinase and response regulator CckA